jgi:riboflavin biosynthesis pyrimidine reductase
VEGVRFVARPAMSLDGYIADADGGYDWIRLEYVRRQP